MENHKTQRLDQWLVFARFVKTREQAKLLISKGKMRINQHKRADISDKIKQGDILTFIYHTKPVVIQIDALIDKRCSAKDKHLLYHNELDKN